MLPTEQPFLYTISATVTAGIPLASVEAAALEELERVRTEGVTPQELAAAKMQLNARLVFDGDSITNIAHQLGYFETIASVDLFTTLPPRIRAVDRDEVAAAARSLLAPANRTIGLFDPVPVPSRAADPVARL
jgi:zinc protease